MNAQPDTAALLRRFEPCLRYDSLEGYFSDSAEEWTVNPGNRLRRADGTSETVLRIHIEELQSTGLSFMPEGLEKQIDVPAMADLLEYLTSSK